MKSRIKTFLKTILDNAIAFCTRNHFGLKILRYIPKGYSHILDVVVYENSSRDFVVFDVGANIGQSVHYYKKHLKNPVIYSFEPVNSTFNKLSENVSHLKHVNVVNKALGSETGKIEIELSPQSLNNSLKAEVFSTAQSDNFQQVEVVTLNNYCKDNNIAHIDLLKIDTEGFDLEVLKGSIEMLKGKKIKYILTEVGFNNEPHKVRLYKIIDYLSNHNYHFSGLYDVVRKDFKSLHVFYANALFQFDE